MTTIDGEDGGNWPARPWIMAAAGAVGGLIFHLLVDNIGYSFPPEPAVLWRMAAATFVAVATLGFIITAERLRLAWAIAFAVGWGAVMALVGYFTASYDRTGEIAGFPFLSGLLAVGIAAPLFQTMRDQGRRSLPYEKVHRYAWTDAIIGGASMAFTGLTFLLAFLLASLFDAIGISLLKDLLRDEWFGWILAGAAFGAASAVLRERDPLLGTLQKLVMVVFSVLAPVLAFALAVYLLALPATGLAGLWKSGLPETPLLLSAAAFAVVFLNAIIGDSPGDRGTGRLWRVTEGVLLLAVLPLGVLALVSMGLRVGQYGWTPERLWGVIACLVAIAYGVAAWVAAARARRDFDGPLRESQKHLALGLCGLALLLALPIIDFGAISARSQVARLESGRVTATEFDWAAMAFDFGPAGRNALEEIAGSGAAEHRQLASTALKSKDRGRVEVVIKDAGRQAGIERRVRLLSPDIDLTPAVRQRLAGFGGCKEDTPCAVLRIDSTRLLVVWHGADKSAVTNIVDLARDPNDIDVGPGTDDLIPKVEDLQRARIEIRTVERRQAFIDGKPAGDPFE